jgi:hypothetical protein
MIHNHALEKRGVQDKEKAAKKLEAAERQQKREGPEKFTAKLHPLK